MESIVEKEKGVDQAAGFRSVIITKIVAGHLGWAFDAGKSRFSIQNVLIYQISSVILPQEYSGAIS